MNNKVSGRMIIVLLADVRWIHSINWANGLSNLGHDVHLISMHKEIDKLETNVTLHRLPFKAPFGYFLNLLHVRKLLSQIKPDLMNSHYASGYGTLSMLVGFRPTALSIWGSDVYEFPEKSQIHKWLIMRNLNKADAVFSTSKTMASRSKNFLNYKREIYVTPFGIDLDKFSAKGGKKSQKIVIGTVKKLEDKYGIDILLRVFHAIINNQRVKDSGFLDRIEFLIVGGGSKENDLKELSSTLGIENRITFTGHVPHYKVPEILSSLDIYFALSRSDSESFGVAILEASACNVPVIVSDKGGLWEVVDPGKTGYIFSINKLDDIANATIDLIFDDKKRKEMGNEGRLFVERNYSWSKTLNKMVESYNNILENR